MKNASQRMFKYGNLVNKIYFIVAVCLIPLGILLVVLGIIPDPIKQELIDAGSKALGWGIYFTILTILCFIFVLNKAQKELQNENNESFSPYIISIVFGALSENPFYVLGGIFGIIAQSQENNKNNKEEPKQIKEEKKEEPKEEEPKAE